MHVFDRLQALLLANRRFPNSLSISNLTNEELGNLLRESKDIGPHDEVVNDP